MDQITCSTGGLGNDSWKGCSILGSVLGFPIEGTYLFSQPRLFIKLCLELSLLLCYVTKNFTEESGHL